MTTAFPPPSATRAEIKAWKQARRQQRLAAVLEEIEEEGVLQWKQARRQQRLAAPKCAACRKACEQGNEPLLTPVCIRFSAKYKGRVFEAGERVCHRHSKRPATADEVEAARAAKRGAGRP